MTLEEAVAILNRHRHRGFDGWEIPSHRAYIVGWQQYDFLEPFEAISIAEKYEREVAQVPDQAVQ